MSEKLIANQKKTINDQITEIKNLKESLADYSSPREDISQPTPDGTIGSIDREGDIEILMRSNHVFRQENTLLKEQNEKLKTEYDTLERYQRDLAKENKQLIDQNQKLVKELTEMVVIANDRDITIDKLKEKNEYLEIDKDNLVEQLATQKQMWNQERTKRLETEGLKDSYEEIERLQEQLETVTQQFNQERSKRLETEGLISQMGNDVLAAATDLRVAKRNHSDLREELRTLLKIYPND